MPTRYMDKTISVIGLGYIGLPTAAAFAARKVKVIGVDINAQTVETINRGQIDIVEPELDMVVQAAVNQGYLRAVTTPEQAEAFLIAVPTPFKGDHKPDLRYIEAAAQSIAPVLQKGNLVILESTSPVGTTEQMAAWLAAARPDLTFPQQAGEASDIRIAHCPERVLPGHVMRELVENDRIIGGMTTKCSEAAAGLYKIFVEGACIITNARTAEMCKLTENSFRDVNIAFANELSIICDKLAINVWELIRLANHHPRVNILQPGVGVGGHCIAVDPWFVVDSAPDEARLIRTARAVNDEKTRWALHKIDQAIAQENERGTALQDITIACLGLAYKANIDDLRESPALAIVQALADKHPGRIAIVEPHIEKLPDLLENSNVIMIETETVLDWASIIIVLVDHKQFRTLRFDHRDKAHVVDLAGIRKDEQ